MSSFATDSVVRKRFLSNVVKIAVFAVAMSIFLADAPAPELSQSYVGLDVVAPRLTGWKLKFAAYFLHSWAGSFYVARLKRVNKFNLVDVLANTRDDQPTFYPIHELSDQEFELHARLAEQFDLAQFASAQAKLRPNASSDNNNSAFPLLDSLDHTRAYASGKITPLRVAQQLIQAVHASNELAPPLLALQTMNEQDVLAQAEASTARYRSGKPLGPLDGVFISVKDELDVQGYPSTCGTSFFADLFGVAKEDAFAVAKLRAAGAVIFMKSTTHELSIGPFGHNKNFPNGNLPRNAFSLSHYPGGSSGGCASAVAAGLGSIGLGTDGAGSVRIPASLNGVVGFKPTFGRVSTDGDRLKYWTEAHQAPITASVYDAAVSYAVMAQRDLKDATTHRQPPVHLHDYDKVSDLSDLRLGVFWPYFSHAQPDVVRNCDTVLKMLAARGAKLVNITIPNIDVFATAQVLTILSQMGAGFSPFRAEYMDRLGPDTRVTLALAASFTSTEFVQAQRVRSYAIAVHEQLFSQADAIVTPTTATTAPKIEPDSFEAGHDSLGLPVSVQFAAKWWQEHTLLRLANAAERLIATNVELRARKREASFDVLSNKL